MQPAVEFRSISKHFGHVKANADVSFSIAKGSIHGLVGENGAGKSTLMSILYGYYRADGGEILLDGKVQPIRNSQEAINLGIGMVHQHFMLVENFTVLDNIMLGTEGGFRLASHRAEAEAKLREICARYRLDVDPLAKIEDLSVGAQQRVEILKQIYRSANILILDEPTAVLTAQETASLFEILRLFKEQGKTIILITHKLQEILEITDNVTVMRGGTVVGAVATAGTSKEELANMMVGRPIQSHLPRAPYNPGATVLEVDGLQLADEQQVKLLADIGFNLRAGEIVAIAGVSGNGQSELLEILSGMRLPTSGKLRFLDKDLPFAKRHDADGLPLAFRELGIAHIPEDRLRDGVVKNFSVMQNTILGYQDHLKNRWGLFNFKAIGARCARTAEDLRRAPGQSGPAHRPAVGRQPAKGGDRARSAGAAETDAGGPAHARRRHRHHRKHPYAIAGPARRRRGDPAGVRRTGRSAGAGRPHPRHVRRTHHRRTEN